MRHPPAALPKTIDEAEALAAHWVTLRLGVDLDAPPDESVTLRSRPPSGEGEGPTPEPPPHLPMVQLIGPVGSDFEVREVLGEGGMARVHLGWQRSVGREVAIKIPKAGPGRGRRIAALVREARITGRLEHPNVAPMHGLGRTPDGVTVMTMKRIEGVSWRAALDDPAALPERFRIGDRLESHLRILLELCDAVHFAHSRGVLHRDLKPDNVLLGAFGEVYLADWGIAVMLGDGPRDDDLPRAVDVRDPAGTPGYMAPEMAAGDGPALGPHSDVYGLGAVLHRILTGRPRHEGARYVEVLASAFRSAPFDYDPSLPRQLTAICTRANARAPGARFPDAAAFRRALAEFLEQRSSSRLMEDANRSLSALTVAIHVDDEHAVDRHFGAARFALEHALRVWPGNREARHTLDGLLIAQATRALDARRTSYAEGLISAVEGADPAHAATRDRLVARAASLRDRRRRLGRLEREVDLRVFSRHRGLVAIGLGVLWAINGLRRAATPPTVRDLLVDQLWMAGVVLAVVVVLRRWMWSTRANRRVSLALIGIVALDSCVRVAGWQLGLDPPRIAAMELMADAGGVLLVALLVDLRLLVAFAVMAGGAAWGLTHLDAVFPITAWTVSSTLALMGLIWLVWPGGEAERGG